MTGVALLAVAVTSTALAQVSYRLFFLRRRWVILAAALALFVVAQLGFFGALTQLDIGVVYMSLGLTQVLVLFLSGRVLGEHITRDHAIAVGAIVLGMTVYTI